MSKVGIRKIVSQMTIKREWSGFSILHVYVFGIEIGKCDL